MDARYSYGAPFAIKILVVPVHPIRRSEYGDKLALLRENSRVALADIPPSPASTGSAGNHINGASISSLLQPSPTSRGFVQLDFVTNSGGSSNGQDGEDSSLNGADDWLHEYQPYRRTMGVIGILDCTEWTEEQELSSLQEGAQLFNELTQTRALSNIYAKRCYAFNPVEEQKDNAEGLVVIPGVGDPGFYVKTLLAELMSGVLAGLSRLMAEIDAKPHFPTPRQRPLSSHFSQNPPNPYFPDTSAKDGQTVRSPSGSLTASNVRTGLPQGGTAGMKSAVDVSALGAGSSIKRSSTAPIPQSPIPEQSDAKGRKRNAARAAKMRGDIYCLSGRLFEGISCYNEAISGTKALGDTIWQASATESLILAQVYQSWATSQSSQGRTPSHTPRPSLADLTKHPANETIVANASLGKELPAQYATVLSMYARTTPQRNSATLTAEAGGTVLAPPSALDASEHIHPLLYAEACLRYARMQLALLLCGSWDMKAVNLMAGHFKHLWPTPSQIELFKQSLNCTFSRFDVSNTVYLAYTHAISPSISYNDKIGMLNSIATLYGKLHLLRKKATVLRELAAVAADAVSRRRPKVDGSGEGRNSLALDRGSDFRLPGATADARKPTVVKSTPDATGNEAVMKIIERSCRVYGISVVAPGEITSSSGKDVESATNTFPDSGIEDRSFGWPSLQVALVKDAISISEILPDYQGAIRFTITALRELSAALPPSDQYRLSQSIERLFQASQRRGDRFEMAYWGPKQLVMSIEVSSLPATHVPTEHPYVDASATNTAAASQIVKKDPFIHSANRNSVDKAGVSKPTLVQGEVAEFFVTLQNPFLLDLDIESIEVSTTGVPCKVNVLHSSIPPSSFHTIRISCIPEEAGTLVVRGCKISIAGCKTREFVVPLAPEGGDGSSGSRAKDLASSTKRDRLKRVGLEHLAVEEKVQSVSNKSRNEHRFLECTVVPAQPLLRLKDVNLMQGALMLYEGETTPIRMELENPSSLPVDFVKLTFQDSHTSALRSYLQENEVSAIETYDIESGAAELPVLRWSNQSEWTESKGRRVIQPDGRFSLEAACFGKAGLTSGTIQLDYAYIHRPESAEISHFHSRQIVLPVSTTVHPSIRCTALNLLRVQALPAVEKYRHRRNMSSTSVGRALAIDDTLEESLQDMDEHSNCLLVLQVENQADRQAFEVVLQTRDGSGGRIKQRIEPGCTTNLLLPISRYSLTAEQISQPVPSLSNKQFILGKDRTSPSELELFWYRQELLRNLRLDWREVGTRRAGQVDIRRLALTTEMLQVLKLEDVSLTVRVSTSGDDETDHDEDPEETEWSVECGDFVNLCISVRNQSARLLHLDASIHIQHTGSSSTLFDAQSTPLVGHYTQHDSVESELLSRHVLIDGSDILPLTALEPNSAEAAEAEFPVCFLAKGAYSFICSVAERTHSNEGQGTVLCKRVVRFVVS